MLQAAAAFLLKWLSGLGVEVGAERARARGPSGGSRLKEHECRRLFRTSTFLLFVLRGGLHRGQLCSSLRYHFPFFSTPVAYQRRNVEPLLAENRKAGCLTAARTQLSSKPSSANRHENRQNSAPFDLISPRSQAADARLPTLHTLAPVDVFCETLGLAQGLLLRSRRGLAVAAQGRERKKLQHGLVRVAGRLLRLAGPQGAQPRAPRRRDLARAQGRGSLPGPDGREFEKRESFGGSCDRLFCFPSLSESRGSSSTPSSSSTKKPSLRLSSCPPFSLRFPRSVSTHSGFLKSSLHSDEKMNQKHLKNQINQVPWPEAENKKNNANSRHGSARSTSSLRPLVATQGHELPPLRDGPSGRSKAHAVKPLSSHCSVFAVFDGHNGPLAAEHLAETLIETLHARLPKGRPPRRQGCCLSDSGKLFCLCALEKRGKKERESGVFEEEAAGAITKTGTKKISPSFLSSLLFSSQPIPNEQPTKKTDDDDFDVEDFPEESANDDDVAGVPLDAEQQQRLSRDNPCGFSWRGQVQAALAATFHDLQASWAARGKLGGATCTIALVCGRLLTVGNVGDSLALLDTGASVMALTGDHRVHNSKREQERVRALGGLVTSIDAGRGCGPAADPRTGLGPLRVWPGGVANARAIGDLDVPGGFLLPAPHLTQVRLPADGAARIVLASDGIWDSVDIHRAAKLARGHAAPEAADRILTQAVRAQGGVPRDDATVIVVDVLPPGAPSFAEALGRKVKRSASRAAALALAGSSAPPSPSGGKEGSLRGGRSFANGGALSEDEGGRSGGMSNRGGYYAAAAAAAAENGGASSGNGGGGGGGLFGCCAGAPATTGDDDGGDTLRLGDPAVSGSPNSGGENLKDKSVRGGGYGPSVRGGTAFLGAIPGSRRHSEEREADGASATEGSHHSGSTRGGASAASTRGGTAFYAGGGAAGGAGGSQRPRVAVLAQLDTAVLLGQLPPCPADVSQEAAGAWMTDELRGELRALQEQARNVHARRTGAAARKPPHGGAGLQKVSEEASSVFSKPAALPPPVQLPKSAQGPAPMPPGGSAAGRGRGQTPVVVVPKLPHNGSYENLKSALEGAAAKEGEGRVRGGVGLRG